MWPHKGACGPTCPPFLKLARRRTEASDTTVFLPMSVPLPISSISEPAEAALHLAAPFAIAHARSSCVVGRRLTPPRSRRYRSQQRRQAGLELG